MSSPAPFDDVVAKLTAANLGYPVALPNTVFKRPQPPAPWLRVEVTSSMLDPLDLGADVWQETGTAYIEVMVPTGSGSTTARTIAKNVANIFRDLASPQTVVYLGGSIGAGSIEQDDGVWWCLPVSIDWKYQDINA